MKEETKPKCNCPTSAPSSTHQARCSINDPQSDGFPFPVERPYDSKEHMVKLNQLIAWVDKIFRKPILR